MGRNPASRQIPEHVHPVDLSAAHRNHRHQTRAPQHRHDVARRVTSETGRGVTFLSGVYTLAATPIFSCATASAPCSTTLALLISIPGAGSRRTRPGAFHL